VKKWGTFRIVASAEIATPPTVSLTKTGSTQARCRLAANEGYSNREGEFVVRTNYLTLIMFGPMAAEFYRVARVHDRVCVIGHLRIRSWEVDGKKFKTTFMVGEEWWLTGTRERKWVYADLARRPVLMDPKYMQREDHTLLKKLDEARETPVQEENLEHLIQYTRMMDDPRLAGMKLGKPPPPVDRAPEVLDRAPAECNALEHGDLPVALGLHEEEQAPHPPRV
jgi:hypothetical protein